MHKTITECLFFFKDNGNFQNMSLLKVRNENSVIELKLH